MLSNKIEDSLRKTLRWQKVEDIPSFPWRSHSEIKEKTNANEISILIDFSAANDLALKICGRGYMVWGLFLSFVPYLGLATSLVLAIILKTPFWLLAIPIIIAAELGSNPLNPFVGFFRLTMLFVFGYFLWTTLQTQIAGSVLSAFYIVPYWANTAYYLGNRSKVKRLAIDSEALFIFLYQKTSLALMDGNGELHYFRDDIPTESKER